MPSSSKRAVLITAVVALIAPVLFWAAAKALATNSNEVLDWLPQNFEETQRLIWFAERFGSDELIAVGWEGCSISDKRIDRFVELASVATCDDDDERMFGDVTSGRHVARELMNPPLELSAGATRDKLLHWLVGKQGATCIIARVNTDLAYPEDGVFRLEALGEVDRIAAVQILRDIAEEIGIPAAEFRIAGPTVDSVAIDLAGRQWTILMGAASVFAGFALAWLCLRNWPQVIAVFTTSLIAAATSLAIVHFSGNEMDAVLMTMPAIIFVLATSGGIHLTHYLNESLHEKSGAGESTVPRDQAPWRAIQLGIVPCSLACVTTAIGLGSLGISRVRPVIRFGVFSGIGVAVCLVLLLLFWPSFSQVLLRRKSKSTGSESHDESGSDKAARLPTNNSTNNRSGGFWWQPLYWLTTRCHWAILVIAFVGLTALGYGLTQINASVHLKSLLKGSNDLLLSYDWLEEQIGPMVPVEVVLQFPLEESTARQTLQHARTVETLRREIESLDRSGATVAATTFAPEIPDGSGVRNTMTRTLIGRRLHSSLARFRELGFVSEDEQHQLWRISTRVSAGELDYASFLDEVDATVEETLQFENEQRPVAGKLQAKVCGAVPLIQMAQKQLLSDFIWSLTLAFVLIGLTIVVLLRSPMAGLVSMVPNVFPTVVVFGWMGWKGTPIDIGTMMTASVALGVAVDDTLHFLVWVRRGLLEGKSRDEAIHVAFEQSATAMLQTSLICGIGMSPFIVSPFGPIAGFAGMMCALLMMALVGDLILLPALIASPLGKSFEPKT